MRLLYEWLIVFFAHYAMFLCILFGLSVSFGTGGVR